MTNEQTNEGDTGGKETNTPVASDTSLVQETNTSTTMIDAATMAADRIEKANAQMAKNLDRQEALDARRALGGISGGGIPKVEKSPEELIQEEAARFLKEQ